MPGFVVELGEGEAGTQRSRRNRDGQTSQEMTRTWVQAKAGKGGSSPSQDTAVDAGMRRRAQERAAEGGRWWVHMMSRYMDLSTRRVDGDQVKTRGL